MKIVVIGGSGVLGSKVVEKLRDRGQEAVPASPRTGVDTLTGDGLAEALSRAGAVVDVANPPTFDDDPVMAFFTTSTTHLVAADLAGEVARVAQAAPINGVENVGGPEKITFERLVRDVLAGRGETKTVVVDPQPAYFGTPLATDSLVVP